MFFCFLLVFQKSSSLCRENEIFENTKPKKPKNLDQFSTYKNANLGQVFKLQHIYICVCVCVVCLGTFVPGNASQKSVAYDSVVLLEIFFASLRSQKVAQAV